MFPIIYLVLCSFGAKELWKSVGSPDLPFPQQFIVVSPEYVKLTEYIFEYN